MLFASMTKIDEMRINEAKFDSFTFSQWALEHIRKFIKKYLLITTIYFTLIIKYQAVN